MENEVKNEYDVYVRRYEESGYKVTAHAPRTIGLALDRESAALVEFVAGALQESPEMGGAVVGALRPLFPYIDASVEDMVAESYKE